jgi:hypothetical protein
MFVVGDVVVVDGGGVAVNGVADPRCFFLSLLLLFKW